MMSVTSNHFSMLSAVMLSAVMLSVVMIIVVMLNATNNPFMLGVVMLNIIMLIVVENLATSIRMGHLTIGISNRKKVELLTGGTPVNRLHKVRLD